MKHVYRTLVTQSVGTISALVADRQNTRLVRTNEHIEITHFVLLKLGLLGQR